MPGNLASSSPSGVLPQSLSTAFAETRLYPLLSNQYHDGTSERVIIQDGVNAPSSLRTWRQSKRLTSAALITLRNFFESKAGGLPFYFYNPYEPQVGHAIGSNYDATGVSTQGRHPVYFLTQEWQETTDIGRTVTNIEMREIA